MEVRPVGAELYHADGRTDRMKLRVAFHNFANMPTMAETHYIYICSK